MIILGEISDLLDIILGGTMEVCRATDQKWHCFCQIVDYLSTGGPGGHFSILWKNLDMIHEVIGNFAVETSM